MHKLTLIAFTLVSLSANADIPNGFQDWGSSTYQTSTSLEWLDVTDTLGRSYDDVLADITDSPTQYYDEFDLSEGWRYATQEEFRQLVSEWFDLDYQGGMNTAAPFGHRDESIVEDFVLTFGDTQDRFFDGTSSTLDIDPDGSGAVMGIVGSYPGSQTWKHLIGQVSDSEIVYRSSGANYKDSDDILNDTGALANNHKHPLYGSFLVRKVNVVTTNGD